MFNGKELADFLSGHLAPCPVGVNPVEVWWAVWRDGRDGDWKVVPPKDAEPGRRYFRSLGEAEQGARAATDDPDCMEARVIRCAQEVPFWLKGPAAL